MPRNFPVARLCPLPRKRGCAAWSRSFRAQAEKNRSILPRAMTSTAGFEQDEPLEPRFGFDLWRPEARIRLRSLVVWRWAAVFGQCATLFAVDSILDYALPLFWCLMAVTASAWLNIVVSLRHPFSRLLSDGEATAYLV